MTMNESSEQGPTHTLTDERLTIIRDALRDLHALRPLLQEIHDTNKYVKAEQLLIDVDSALRSLRA